MRRRVLTGVDRYAAAAPPHRTDAVERLTTHGFPGFKDEDWYYTPTRKLLAEPFTPVVGAARPPGVELPDGQRLVFVDGIGHQDTSAPLPHLNADDPVGELIPEPLGFDALNAALWRDGARLTLQDGDRVQLVHVTTGERRLGCVRHRVHVRGEATLVERHLGQPGEALLSEVVEITLAEGATLHHVVIQELPAEASAVHTVAVRASAGARYQATSVQLGARLSRLEQRVELASEGARAHLHGLAIGRGRAHIDHHVFIDHAAPRCVSTQSFRSVLDDAARSVFTGKVMVREGATGTDSDQSNRNLLLSDDAVANTRPQLEIYTDDVTCAHGATVGTLDEDALFYLRQRGLAPRQAQALLTEAFAGEVVAAIDDEGARADAADRVRARIQAALGGHR